MTFIEHLFPSRMKFGSWTVSLDLTNPLHFFLNFVSISIKHDGFKIDLINSSTTADLFFYVPNGEWDLLSAKQQRNVVVYTCCIEPYPDVTFYVWPNEFFSLIQFCYFLQFRFIFGGKVCTISSTSFCHVF